MYGLFNRAVKGLGRMHFVPDDDQVRRAIVGPLEADGWAVDATGAGDRAIEACGLVR